MTLLHGSTLLTAYAQRFSYRCGWRDIFRRDKTQERRNTVCISSSCNAVSAEEVRQTPSLSIPVTGDPRPARHRRLGSGTGCAVGRTLSAGASLSLAGGKQLLLRQCLFDGNKYKPVCAVCQRGIYWSFSSSSAAVSAMVSAPASVSVRRLRNPQLTATRGSPAFRAVDTSTSLSPT